MKDTTEDLVAELKAKHGDNLAGVEIDGQLCIFKAPGRAVYDRWFDGYSGTDKSKRSFELALSCLVHPDKQTFIACLDRAPAALTTVVDTEIIKLAGAEKDSGLVRPVKL
jgi:hypothetical protein